MEIRTTLVPTGPASVADLDRLAARVHALAGDETSDRVTALIALASALSPNEAARQADLADEAYALAGRIGDEAGIARSAGIKGRALFFLSENEAAAAHLTESIARLDALGLGDERLSFRGALAGAHANLGRYEEALAGGLANLDDVRASGDRTAEGWVLHGLSAAYADLGDADRALDTAQQARALFTEIGFVLGLARAETAVGTALLLRDSPDAAEEHLTRALSLFHDLDDAIGESRALNDLGTVARLRGDVEAGLTLHREALARRRGTANRQAQSTSLLHVGEALVALGRPEEAVEALAEALSLAEGVGARPREEQVHAVLVEAYGALGDPSRALEHARAHLAVREAILDAQTRGRLQTMQVRYETERIREARDAEAVRSAALRDANNRLVDTLDELRSAQRQLVQTEKLASLGRVTAGIAHEIRNPLNFVVGFSNLASDLVAELAETLVRYPVPDPAAAEAAAETIGLLRDNLTRVDEHARRANDIVTSMLEHVRTVGGPRGQVVVSDLVEMALADVRDDAPPGLRFALDDASGGAEVVAVAGSVRRVFSNLFCNAFAALAERAAAEREPSGRGATECADGAWVPTLTVALRVLAESEVGPAVEVTVADNGPGLSPDVRARVFEPFFTTRPTGQGTGLGLSLAYDIVTQGHGGLLETRDTPGDGATFVVTLPVSGER